MKGGFLRWLPAILQALPKTSLEFWLLHLSTMDRESRKTFRTCKKSRPLYQCSAFGCDCLGWFLTVTSKRGEFSFSWFLVSQVLLVLVKARSGKNFLLSGGVFLMQIPSATIFTLPRKESFSTGSSVFSEKMSSPGQGAAAPSAMPDLRRISKKPLKDKSRMLSSHIEQV